MEIFNRKDKSVEEDNIMQAARDCCEKIIDSTKQIEESKREYKLVQSRLSDIQNIEMLSQEQLEYLINVAKNVSEIEKDKINYRAQTYKLSDDQYNHIVNNEEKMIETLKSVDDEEKRLQKIKSDMNYLEGEMGALKIEKKEYKNKLYLLQGISKIAIISLFILFVGLIVAEFVLEIDTKLYILILILIAIIITLIVFMVNRNTLYQLKLNQAKLNRAITLLNKVKLQYVNAFSGIQYIYDKNKVHNSYELKNLWAEYCKLKQNKVVYKQTSNKLYNVIEELYELMDRYKLNDANDWLNKLDIIIYSNKRNDAKMELNQKRLELKDKLDHFSNVLEQSKLKLKEQANNHKEHTQDILKLVDQYGDLFKQFI